MKLPRLLFPMLALWEGGGGGRERGVRGCLPTDPSGL